MKPQYDFRKGRRGQVLAPVPPPRKQRITICLDPDLLEYFRQQGDQSKTGYQTLINDALRQFTEGKAAKIEDTLRRIVREEIRAAS